VPDVRHYTEESEVRDAYNFEENISGGVTLTLLDLPLSDTTSVMVGLIAGMVNLDNAFLRAEACISGAKMSGIREHWLGRGTAYA